MALDRTWYNSLVDDDGSGLTGSVWDKADVDALMDAVDAEIARIDAGTQVGSTNAVIMSSGGGTPLYAAQTLWYARAGRGAIVNARLTLTSKGSLAPGAVQVSLPFTPAGTCALQIGFYAGVAAAVGGLFVHAGGTGGTGYVYKIPAGGAVTPAFLNVADITDSFDITLSGAYVTT
jgi:hypothetical protein